MKKAIIGALVIFAAIIFGAGTAMAMDEWPFRAEGVVFSQNTVPKCIKYNYEEWRMGVSSGSFRAELNFHEITQGEWMEFVRIAKDGGASVKRSGPFIIIAPIKR